MRRITVLVLTGIFMVSSAFAEFPLPNANAETEFDESPDPVVGAATADSTFHSSVNTTPKPEGAWLPDYVLRSSAAGDPNDTSLSNDSTASGDNTPPPPSLGPPQA